jgi:lipid-binding SYLF domain-containing protein
MKHFGTLFLVLVLCLPAVLAAGNKTSRSDDVNRLRRATEVFHEIMSTPDKGIPQDLLDKASCVAIVPGVTKGGIGLGGAYGRGVVLCRGDRGSWSPPAFITVEGGSAGLQLGLERIDLVMLIMNREGMDKLLGDKFTIGGDASVAAGPVGRHTSADTDIKMSAQILTYSRAKGLFGGLALNGAVVKPDNEANRSFYGKDVTARAILMEHAVPMPPEARPLANALSHQVASR